MLVCTESWKKNDLLEKYTSINFSLFHQIITIPSGEPESDLLDKINSEMDSDIEEIIALGGGSTIDSAKMLGVLNNNNNSCADYEFDRKISPSNVIPIIAIPTTAGSGSESTMYTVINNSQTHRKFTLTDYSIMPHKVLLCPELTLNLPKQVTIASGMDAFIQAFEAFFSKTPNPVSSSLAPFIMYTILKNLEEVVKNPHNLDLRKLMQEVSYLSGICINYSRTGLIHTISVSLSKYHSNLHGELNTIIMPHVIEFNKFHYELSKSNLEFLLKSLNMKSIDEFINQIFLFCKKLDLKLFSKLKIDKKEIIERIFQDSGLSIVNPREIDEKQLSILIERILK